MFRGWDSVVSQGTPACGLLSLLDFKAVPKGPLPAGGFQAPVTVASSISSVSLSMKKRGLDTKRDGLTLEPDSFPGACATVLPPSLFACALWRSLPEARVEVPLDNRVIHTSVFT